MLAASAQRRRDFGVDDSAPNDDMNGCVPVYVCLINQNFTRIRRAMWCAYADALVRCEKYEDAKAACEKILELSKDGEDGMRTVVRARIHLSLILRELKLDSKAQRQ